MGLMDMLHQYTCTKSIASPDSAHDPPGVLDKIGGFYADHPQLVKTLGSAALAIALAGG